MVVAAVVVVAALVVVVVVELAVGERRVVGGGGARRALHEAVRVVAQLHQLVLDALGDGAPRLLLRRVGGPQPGTAERHFTY